MVSESRYEFLMRSRGGRIVRTFGDIIHVLERMCSILEGRKAGQGDHLGELRVVVDGGLGGLVQCADKIVKLNLEDGIARRGLEQGVSRHGVEVQVV